MGQQRSSDGAQAHDRRPTDRITLGAAVAAVLAVAGAWLLGGVDLGGGSASHGRPAANPSIVSTRPGGGHAAGRQYGSIAATARGSRVDVYPAAGARKPLTRLRSPNIDGAPLVFLVQSRSGAWAHVLLPTRPNGSAGWIRLSQVRLTGVDYHVVIYLTQHKLTVRRGRRLVIRTPIGVGRAVTPTPAGRYYITELLKQPDPTGVYGPYAFGMSVHSNVLHEFAGRDGILGIHGTNFPQGIGTDVSHGCIRMSNAAIRKLARILPLGTPVMIVRGA
jgi:lipoprotein-anchoring transpeptidase ErfK/SrfK